MNSSSYQGRLKETTQMGVERIGDSSPDADAELLAMTVECLLAAGLKEFQVSVGQVNYFKSLLKEAGMDEEAEEQLRSLISQKNYFGVEELMEEKKMDPGLSKVFQALPQLFGSYEVLEKARSLTDNPEALKAVERLEEIYEILKLYGYEKYISFDFGMVSKIQYYTGVIFQAYTYGTGEPLVKGGRYDELLKHFGKTCRVYRFCDRAGQPSYRFVQTEDRGAEEEPPVILTYTRAERRETVLKAQKLRKEGKPVALRQKKEELK